MTKQPPHPRSTVKTKLVFSLLVAATAIAVSAMEASELDALVESKVSESGARAESKASGFDVLVESGTPLLRPSFAETWIAGRLAVGPAVSRISVRDRHVPYDPEQPRNFLGNINDMQEDGCTGLGISVRYALLPWLAVEASGPGRADLRACNKDGESCDGTLRLRTWGARFLLRWPAEDWWVNPYAGFGFEHVSASFKHAPWWNFGWSSPEDYEKYGNGSKQPHNDASRRMELSSPGLTPCFSLGAAVRLHANAELDLFGSWTDSDDVDVVFHRTDGGFTRPMRSGAFPTKHVSYGVALRYVF